jgi:hypothetical protein
MLTVLLNYMGRFEEIDAWVDSDVAGLQTGRTAASLEGLR